VKASSHAGEFAALEGRYADAVAVREARAREMLHALDRGDDAARAGTEAAFTAASTDAAAVRQQAIGVMREADPKANTSDTNYVFLTFVTRYLPSGLLGLLLAAVFAAAMNSSSSELNALASTTVVDVYRRHLDPTASERRTVLVGKLATVGWGAFAIALAESASRLGSLVEAVNILGSLFYGTILGIFMTGFLVRRAGGTAVFAGAVVAEIAVIACFKLTKISFLWYNLIGCAIVMAVAVGLSFVLRRGRA